MVHNFGETIKSWALFRAPVECVMAVLVLHGSVLVTALFVCYQALECLSKGLFTASALIVVCAICSQLLCRKFGLWLRAGVKMKLEL